jgi:hypothetical protein
MPHKPRLKPMLAHASWEWATPKKFYEALDAEFHFDFDPCPLGGDVDGRSPLFCSWKGKRAYCNPAYGPEISKFLKRWHEPDIAVYLLPVRSDTKWFHDLVLPNATEIRFIKGRLRFGDGKNCAPFPSMVVVFDNRKKPDGGWPDGYHTDRGDADALADALAAEEAEKIGWEVAK